MQCRYAGARTPMQTRTAYRTANNSAYRHLLPDDAVGPFQAHRFPSTSTSSTAENLKRQLSRKRLPWTASTPLGLRCRLHRPRAAGHLVLAPSGEDELRAVQPGARLLPRAMEGRSQGQEGCRASVFPSAKPTAQRGGETVHKLFGGARHAAPGETATAQSEASCAELRRRLCPAAGI